MASLSERLSAAIRQIALDQIAQDIKARETFALKSEVGGNGVVNTEQLIAFFNGYNGTNLDYRDYLTNADDAVTNAIYDFCNSYKGNIQ